jgi:hypothetical protein
MAENDLATVDDEQDKETEVSPLVDWSNPPQISDFKNDISDAKSSTDDHIGKVENWLDNLNTTGKASIKKVRGRSNITPKLIRKQAEWRYSSLSEPFLSTSDMFDVRPVTFEDKDAAVQNAIVLNNQFNTKIQKVKFIDEYVRTAVDEGTVITRVGWAFQEKMTMVSVDKYQYFPLGDMESIQRMEQIIQLKETNEVQFAKLPSDTQEAANKSIELGQPVRAVHMGVKKIEKFTVVKNCPTVEVCDFKNIVIDPTCKGDLEIAEFMSYTFENNIAGLKKEGVYHNLKSINVEGNTILGQPDHDSKDTTNFNFQDAPRKKFVIQEYWGYWDIQGNNILEPIVAAWVGDVLIRLELNPYPDQKLPFVMAQYLPVRKSSFGEPDGELLEDNQKIVGAVTRGMIDTMGRSANGQVGIRKDALDIVNRKKFDAGLDYQYNGGMDPKQAFYMHTYPEIPQSAQYMLGIQNMEAESLTGVKAFSGPQGLSGKALGDSVGGIKSAMDAASKRELGILRRLAEGINQIGRKFISMNADFMSDEEIIRITNDEFVRVRRDDLPGNFDLKLTISTPEADEAKATELSFMMQTLGQTMGPAFTQIIMAENAKLRKMPELAKRIEEFKPEPDPIAEAKAQLEVELLRAQIKNEESKAYENLTDGKLNEAKVGNLNSDTDKKDLDYVEQEKGVNQERDLEKIDRSAGHNLEKTFVDNAAKKEQGEAKNAANSSSKSR